MGLRLSEEKTRITHIDEGFDFLGFRIQRQTNRGTGKRHVYTYPSKAALMAVKAKVRALTRGATHQPLEVLLHRVNPVVRGWANYFRHGASKTTFRYLDAFVWRRVAIWLRHKHPRANWSSSATATYWWRPTEGKVTLFNPSSVEVTRYRYRGAHIPTPWSTSGTTDTAT
jgi:RNA-directed DNA polymerase